MHVWTNGDGILLDSNGVILCNECPCDIDGYVIGVNIGFRNNPSPAYQFAYDGGGTALPTPLPSSDTGWIELTNRTPAFAGDKCLIRLTS